MAVMCVTTQTQFWKSHTSYTVTPFDLKFAEQIQLDVHYKKAS